MPHPSWGLAIAVGCLSLTTVEAANLTIHIVGLCNTRGTVRLSLYNQAETFLDAPVILGPPSFARAAVTLGQEDRAITITIRY
jgi:uncharacterized protein (DUF2141 family)